MRKLVCCVMCFILYLGLSNGYIAMWSENTSKPIKVYPYHISLFPKIDQKRFEKGIPIKSEEEFSKHIEDYLS